MQTNATSPSSRKDLKQQRKSVLSILRRAPIGGVATSAIQAETGLNRFQAFAVLDELRAAGRARCVSRGRWKSANTRGPRPGIRS